VVYAGKTSIITYTEAALRKDHYEAIVDGFITFVHVDKNTNASPHGIILEPKTEEALYDQGRNNDHGCNGINVQLVSIFR
jgi:hypothetical protein